jgi:hypothetical protein
VDEDHLATVSVSTGLSIYNVARPDAPRLLSFAEYSAFPSNDLKVDVGRGLAFVASRYYGLFIFDISDLEDVRLLAQVSDFTSGQGPQGLRVDGTQLWVADLAGVRRYDVSNPSAPLLSSNQALPGARNFWEVGGQLGATVVRSWSQPVYEYAIQGGRLQPLARISPVGIELSPEVWYDGEERSGWRDLWSVGGALLLVERSGQTSFFDVREGSAGLDLARPALQQYPGVFDAVAVGDKLHAVSNAQDTPWSSSDYVIYRVDDPGLGLVAESRTPFPCAPTGINPYDLHVAGGYAHVMCGDYQRRYVHRLSVTDAGEVRYLGQPPSLLSVVKLVGTRDQLIVHNEVRVQYRLAGRLAGYRLPASDLTTPNWTWNPEAEPESMTLFGDTLYARLNNGRTELLDVGFRDGYSPLPPPEIPPSALGNGLVVSGELGFLATRQGLQLLHARTRDHQDRTPKLAGTLTREPTLPISALVLDDAILVLEERRLVRYALERPTVGGDEDAQEP